MGQYNVFISTELGSWQLVGGSPVARITQQISSRIAASQYFDQQPILAVLMVKGSNRQVLLYKRPWEQPPGRRQIKLAISPRPAAWKL